MSAMFQTVSSIESIVTASRSEAQQFQGDWVLILWFSVFASAAEDETNSQSIIASLGLQGQSSRVYIKIYLRTEIVYWYQTK